MDGSIRLSKAERKMTLSIYRSGNTGRVARRAHTLLLLDRGWSYRQIMEALFCSSDLVASVKRRFLEGGLDRALAEEADQPAIPYWKIAVAGWVLHKSPHDFGFFRSRWTCELLARLVKWNHAATISREAVRRALHEMEFAWRRPRPVVGPTDPDYHTKLRKIKRLLATLPEDETAVFQDEVDIHLNPKIGPAWMPVGEQAQVETPGNNVKRHVAGSLVWRSGTLLVSPPGKRRNAQLFVDHLEDLRHRLRRYKRIHVICDNAPFHNCRLVREYLNRWGHRIVIHYLPKYAPETNPIERVWWHLHEVITRNHRCQSIDELIELAYQWFAANNNHYLEMHHTFALAA